MAGSVRDVDREPPREAYPILDGRRARGSRTRRAILHAAVELASATGLEALSIGRLATHLGVSKSGLFAHFGSKVELELAIVDAAEAIFALHVTGPAEAAPPGLPRLAALLDGWLDYLRERAAAGGCVFAHTAHEHDARPGPVRDALAAHDRAWIGALAGAVAAAQTQGELPAGRDPDQIAFELHAAGTMANLQRQLHGDERAFERARAAFTRALAAGPSG